MAVAGNYYRGPGDTLMFAHGFNIRFKQIQPPAFVDVSMVAPKAPGHRVRELFVEGARKVMDADIAALYPFADGVFESPVVVDAEHTDQARDPRPRRGGIAEQV
jgi:hypothetical protein